MPPRGACYETTTSLVPGDLPSAAGNGLATTVFLSTLLSGKKSGCGRERGNGYGSRSSASILRRWPAYWVAVRCPPVRPAFGGGSWPAGETRDRLLNRVWRSSELLGILEQPAWLSVKRLRGIVQRRRSEGRKSRLPEGRDGARTDGCCHTDDFRWTGRDLSAWTETTE